MLSPKQCVPHDTCCIGHSYKEYYKAQFRHFVISSTEASDDNSHTGSGSASTKRFWRTTRKYQSLRVP